MNLVYHTSQWLFSVLNNYIYLRLIFGSVPLPLQVQAHFSAIVPLPCPSMQGLCAQGEDCKVYSTSLPFNGTRPGSGWCVRQWQKKVPSNYRGTITLGYETLRLLSGMF